MFMAIDMIQRQPGICEGLELRPNLPRELAANGWSEEEANAGGEKIGRQITGAVNQMGNLVRPQHRSATGHNQMQPDPQVRQSVSAHHGVGRGGCSDHPARGVEDASAMGLLNRAVDTERNPKIIAGDDQLLQD